MTKDTPSRRVDRAAAELEPERASTMLPASPVLARLIEEVRHEKTERLRAYDRFHNRHNRSR